MKYKLKSFFYIFLITTLLASWSCNQGKGDKITIQLNLTEGKTYYLRMEMNQNILQKISGKSIDIEQKMKIGFQFQVKSVEENGNALVKVTYKSVSFYQDGPMGVISYDSTDDTGVIHALAKGFAALVNECFTMEIAPDGFILDISGADLMLENMLDKLDFSNANQKNQLRGQLKSQFGNKALLSTMENMMSIYPQHKVGIGDSWSKKIQISGMMPMILDTTWTFKERKNGTIILKVKSDIEPIKGTSGVEFGSTKLQYELSGSQKGMMELDESSGWTVKAWIDQKVKGKVMMQNLSWPIEIISEINLISN